MRINTKTLIHMVMGIMMTCIIMSHQTAMAYEPARACNNTQGANVWPTNELPLSWYLNSAGSDNMPFAKVETIIKKSFDEWAKPCCSNFRATYKGTTNETATQNSGRITFSFYETSWPPELGNPYGGVIAVTLLSFVSGCRIIRAPIAYNGIAHNFTDDCTATGCANGGTDLEGVTTHEIGHLLGLGHSPVRDATMYFQYRGGDGARSLHQDDQDGVCTLYPKSCGCMNDSECPSNEKCINQKCEQVPCMNNSECDPGLECKNGDCVVPPCTNDTDCGAGFKCNNGTCEATCPVCKTCNSAQECGTNAACATVGGRQKCLVLCGQGGQCPADSRCFAVPANGRTYNFCLNPDAPSAGICPDTYTCNEPMTDPCANVNCPTAQICQNGQCIPDQTDCRNTGCPAGNICQGGQCVPDPNGGDMAVPPEFDMTTPPPTDMGMNNGDMGTPPGTDPPPVVLDQGFGDDWGNYEIPNQISYGGEVCACAQLHRRNKLPQGSLLILMSGLLLISIRRRRKA